MIIFLILLCLPARAVPQVGLSAPEKIEQVKKLYDAGKWAEVIQLVPEGPCGSADLELYRGLALARLQRWAEARKSFQAGFARNPRDARFLVELAGISYRQKQFSRAKRELRRALSIAPGDDYSNNFLASIYFLEGNLDAALKFWNRAGLPVLSDLSYDPPPNLNPLLLDRAFAFSRGSEWRRDQFLTTQARLQSLDLFPQFHFDLKPQPDGSFNLGFQSALRTGWGGSKWAGAVSMLRGLPYLSVYPEFYNLDHAGLNWLSFVRWDDEKRLISTSITASLEANPSLRYRLYFEGRNENWDLSRTFSPSFASPRAMNMEKAAAGAEIRFIESGNWQWNAGVEFSYRKFRNLIGISAGATPFFTGGSSIALRSGVNRVLVRFPERRFTLDSSVDGEFGTYFENPLGRYGRLQASIKADWLPKARGDDYQIQAQLRAGRTFGDVSIDQLSILGFDRDNGLWLRGHPGLRGGEKGNAPLGRNYVLANWEMDKIIYQGAFLSFKMGPFLDTGKCYDPSGFFGSPKWLTDSGVQSKIRVLGSFEFILGYGKDLRSGNNSFFTTVSR